MIFCVWVYIQNVCMYVCMYEFMYVCMYVDVYIEKKGTCKIKVIVFFQTFFYLDYNFSLQKKRFYKEYSKLVQ